MCYRPYIIEVSGSVLAKEGKNYTQGWTACSCRKEGVCKDSKFSYEQVTHSVRGDLHFDKKLRAVPYALYVVKGSVGIDDGTSPDTGLVCCPGFYPAFAYFHENILDIRECLDISVDIKVQDKYYNGLYTGAFSVLELFLCDFLLCGVFSNEHYYDNALTALEISKKADQFKVESNIKNVVYNKVFHRFEEVEELFETIFDFKFPDWKELHGLLFKRNNIVHRYALTNIDRMRVCDASYDDVLTLITKINRFVNNMKEKCGMYIEIQI